jgi:hypothetical protein
MSKNMKIALIVFGCILLLCTGIAGVAFYWVNTSGREMFQQVKNNSATAMAEGKELGKTSDKNVCLAESVKRTDADPSITSAIVGSAFLSSCLSTAQPTPGFCDGVPQQSEIMKSSEWIVKKCKENGSTGQGCQQLMQAVIQHCAGAGTPAAK